MSSYQSMLKYPTFTENQLLILFFCFNKAISIYNPSTHTVKGIRESYSKVSPAFYAPSVVGGISQHGSWVMGGPPQGKPATPVPSIPTPTPTLYELDSYTMDPRFHDNLIKAVQNDEYILCESLEHAIEMLTESHFPGARELARLLIENDI